MKFQVVKVENRRHEISPNGSDLSLNEAETLLSELRKWELCQVKVRVTPIITLWKSTKLGAFAVDFGNRHYQYKIMQDHYNEMADILNPKRLQLN